MVCVGGIREIVTCLRLRPVTLTARCRRRNARTSTVPLNGTLFAQM